MSATQYSGTMWRGKHVEDLTEQEMRKDFRTLVEVWREWNRTARIIDRCYRTELGG